MRSLLFDAPPAPYYIVSGEARFAPGQGHPSRRALGVFDALIVRAGRLFLAEDTTRFVVAAGHALVLRPDQPHAATQPCEEETRFTWLHFQTARTWSACEPPDRPAFAPASRVAMSEREIRATPFAIPLPQFQALRAPEQVYALLDALAERETDERDVARWEQQQLFQQVLQALAAERPTTETRATHVANQAAAFLRRHSGEPVSYARLHAELSYHPTYLARCMRQVFGCTPLEYLTRWRIEQARRLLITTDLPIKTIAGEVGFQQVPYFTRAFAQRVGMPPHAFRTTFRG